MEQIGDAAFSVSTNRLPSAIDFPLGAFTEISFMYHDEYLLDFINTEELNLNDPQDLNEQERKNGENPSNGILLCKEANF